MKLWITAWSLPYLPNPYRPIPRNTLYPRCRISLRLSSPYLPRRKLRMTHPKPTRQRRFLLLHLHLLTHRPRSLLRLLPLQRNMKHRCSTTTSSDDNCLRRLRTPLRTDVILGCHCHYQPSIRSTLRGYHPC